MLITVLGELYIQGSINENPMWIVHYDALFNGTAVCQGYSNLFYYTALKLGVDIRTIAGYAGYQAHAWNIVKLGNLYYSIDSTWNSESVYYSTPYDWFLCTTRTFESHDANQEYCEEAFNAKYPLATEPYAINSTPCTGAHDTYYVGNVKADCTHDGYEGAECCFLCGEYVTYTRVLEKNHFLMPTVPFKDSTCYEEGVTEKVECSRCGYSEGGEVIPTKPHDLQTYKGYPPTCVDAGFYDYQICRNCSYSTMKGLPALGHDIQGIPGYPATYRTTGLTDGGTCTRCKYKQTQTAIPKLTSKYPLGDMGKNNSVDFMDAIMALQYNAGLITIDDEADFLGDVNNDLTVNYLDAIQMLQYDAKLITKF
ncbi:MAG: hypothetical protein HUJ56_04900, partial [Erysipelotrichaceae bacterium]|nr:hypothetical protein [Erysipelotrichaceae bacterium]